jgi:hypothetical protein
MTPVVVRLGEGGASRVESSRVKYKCFEETQGADATHPKNTVQMTWASLWPFETSEGNILVWEEAKLRPDPDSDPDGHSTTLRTALHCTDGAFIGLLPVL